MTLAASYADSRDRLPSSRHEHHCEERQRRREAILHCAEMVFGRYGIDAATVEQVARDAGVSRALVHLHFGSKSDLVMALCERGLRRLRGQFAAIVERHVLVLDSIEAIAHAYATFARDCPACFQAIARSRALVPGATASRQHHGVCAAAEDVQRLVTRLLTAGAADGSIRADFCNDELLTAIFWGFMHGLTRFGPVSAQRLAHESLSERDLVARSIEMLRLALAPRRAAASSAAEYQLS